jgi:diacylglycerol O-acyltransferase
MRNQLQGAVIAGSLRACAPLERIRSVHDLVSEARRRPLLGLAEDLAGLGRRLPGVPAVLGRVLRSLDMLASNVPGPPAVLYLAGARVERMVPFGPRSGAALNATLLSYNDSVEIGINTDPTAIPDPMVLLDCLRAGFDEVTAA